MWDGWGGFTRTLSQTLGLSLLTARFLIMPVEEPFPHSGDAHLQGVCMCVCVLPSTVWTFCNTQTVTKCKAQPMEISLGVAQYCRGK